MRLAIEPGAVDDVGHLALNDQRKHARPVVWIVFEIAVSNYDDVTGGARQAGSYGGAFASVALVKQNGERNPCMVVLAVGEELEPAAGVQ